jgi:hypothetical protein
MRRQVELVGDGPNMLQDAEWPKEAKRQLLVRSWH